MTGYVVRAVLVGMLASWASLAAGHDTWLLPARFDLPAGGRIELDLTSGMGFPAPGSSVQPNRLPPPPLGNTGGEVPPRARDPGKNPLRPSLRAPRAAVAPPPGPVPPR